MNAIPTSSYGLFRQNIGPLPHTPNALSPRRSRGLQHGKGFTLVELLVVIAIVSLLAALLLPTLSSTREKAMSITCSSNLKQVCTASVMYETDNNGLLPLSTIDGRLDSLPHYWYNALSAYLGGPDPDSYGIVDVYKMPKVFYCPKQLRLKPSVIRSTYGLNSSLRLNPRDEYGNLDGTKRITRARALRTGVDDPNRIPVTASTVPYYMDGIPANEFWYWGWRNSTHPLASEDLKQSYPHNDLCNLVFMDGHIESLPLEHPLMNFDSSAWSKKPRYASYDYPEDAWAF